MNLLAFFHFAALLGLIEGSMDLPPRQDILQTFLFFSSGPLTLVFRDTFCPGLATLIWDNDVFLGTTPSLQTFCGISVRGDTSVIVDPQFTSGEYELAAGFHNLTVLVYGSPTPNGRATVSLILEPQPGVELKMLQHIKHQISNVSAIIPPNPQPLNWLIHDGPKKSPKTPISRNEGLTFGNGRIKLI